MFDLYAASKYGLRNDAAFTGTAATFRIDTPTLGVKALFAIRPTQDCYILQGSSTVTTVTSSNGTFLSAEAYYPLVVEGNWDNHISIIRSSASGNLQISIISDVQSWILTSV